MILYSDIATHKTYVEFWGASTKHPDSISCLQNDIESGNFQTSIVCDEVETLLQWLMYVASRKEWFVHSFELIADICNIVKEYNIRLYDFCM